MDIGGELSGGRKLTATLGMLGAAGVGTALTAGHWPVWLWLPIAGSAALSGVALTRGSIVTRILARGVAWSVLVPTLVHAAARARHGGLPDLGAFAIAASTITALIAAAPALGTRAMRAAFAPAAGRRFFLAGATAVTSAGLATALGALVRFCASWGSAANGLAIALLAAAYLGSAYGLLKMRGWGVLLGGLTSFVLLAFSLFDRAHAAPGWILCALPPLVGIIAPVLLARLGILQQERAPATTPLRIATTEPALVRIADLDLDDESADDAALPRALPRRLSGAPT